MKRLKRYGHVSRHVIRVAVNFFFGLYILEIISFIFFFFSYLEWKSISQAREFLFILACPLKCRLREFWRLIIIYISTEIFGWYFYLQNSTYMTTVLPWVFSWVIFNVVLKFTVGNNYGNYFKYSITTVIMANVGPLFPVNCRIFSRQKGKWNDEKFVKH